MIPWMVQTSQGVVSTGKHWQDKAQIYNDIWWFMTYKQIWTISRTIANQLHQNGCNRMASNGLSSCGTSCGRLRHVYIKQPCNGTERYRIKQGKLMGKWQDNYIINISCFLGPTINRYLATLQPFFNHQGNSHISVNFQTQLIFLVVSAFSWHFHAIFRCIRDSAALFQCLRFPKDLRHLSCHEALNQKQHFFSPQIH